MYQKVNFLLSVAEPLLLSLLNNLLLSNNKRDILL